MKVPGKTPGAPFRQPSVTGGNFEIPGKEIIAGCRDVELIKIIAL
jgi:hypothetical protein